MFRYFDSLVLKNLFLDDSRIKFGKKLFIVFVGTLFLTISAKIQVPLWPVKISMQTFAVISLGVLFGRFFGRSFSALCIILYLIEGAFGFPVFQGTPDRGIGLLYMTGPTAGYLIGFLFSAYIVGFLAERGYCYNTVSAFCIFLLGEILIQIPGIMWLSYLFGIDMAINSTLVFLYPTILKISIGSIIMPKIFNRLK